MLKIFKLGRCIFERQLTLLIIRVFSETTILGVKLYFVRVISEENILKYNVIPFRSNNRPQA